MSEQLKLIIQSVKTELDKDPNGIIAGKINEGTTIKEKNFDPALQIYYDFLSECNGARFGAIDLFGAEILEKYQFMVSDIPGGDERWFYIGQILYEPLLFNKNDLKLYLFYRETEDVDPTDCFGYLDDFLMNYVFGKKYAEIIPDADNDEWYQLLKKLNMGECG